MDEFIDLVTYNLNRIEDLVRRLFDHKYESAQDLWTIQTDLARYQIDLRQKIRNEEDRKKQTVRTISNVASEKKNEWKATLQQLHGKAKDCDRKIDIYKHALMLSKQFGDGFAWIFLKGDSRKIAALAINEPNPSIPEGVTLEAMLGVAEGLANEGAGFPLIHDVTNCLRVGDLTFCNLVEAEDEPLTVEVKSKVLKIEGDMATLQVAIYAPAVQPKFEKVFENVRKRRIDIQEKMNDLVERNSDSERLLGSGPRLQRQVKRMARSRSLQTASHLQTIHNEGNEIFAAMGLKLTPGSFHWDIIRDLAKQARSKGYATQAVDNAFFYTLTYSEKGSVYPWSERSQLPYASEISREIKNSFPLSSKLSNDHICFRTSWDYFSGEVPAYIRPFFTYDLPIDLRLDIMWRRLSIVVYMNINQMVEALKGHGIEARVPANENELNRLFIPIVYSAPVADNQTVEIRGSLAEFANKVGFEFMSLDGFVSCVSQTIAGMIQITKSKAGAL